MTGLIGGGGGRLSAKEGPGTVAGVTSASVSLEGYTGSKSSGMIGLGGGGGGRFSVCWREWCLVRGGSGAVEGVDCVQISTVLFDASYAGGGVIGRWERCFGGCLLTDRGLGTASMCDGLRGSSACLGLWGTEVSTMLGGTDAVDPGRARAIIWDGNVV